MVRGPMAIPLSYYDGTLGLLGELYRPAEPNGRAALVLHEADGIGGNVRRRCAMLAGQGYVALAADLHGGGRVLQADEIGPAMERFRAAPGLLRQRVGAGLHALTEAARVPAGRVVVIGYCFGGMAALELARGGAAIGAAISFHGLLTTAHAAPAGQVKAPILACTGALDPLVPPEDVAAFQAEMTAAGANWQLIVYGSALHSFTNEAVTTLGDPRMAYDRSADLQSWQAMLAFVEAVCDAA